MNKEKTNQALRELEEKEERDNNFRERILSEKRLRDFN